MRKTRGITRSMTNIYLRPIFIEMMFCRSIDQERGIPRNSNNLTELLVVFFLFCFVLFFVLFIFSLLASKKN